MASKSFPKNSSKVVESTETSFRKNRRAPMAPYKKPKNVGTRVHLLDLEDHY